MAELEPPAELIALIDQYLDQQIDAKGHQELVRRLEQGDANRALFVRMCTAHRCYREWARFEPELHDSSVALPDIDESRKIDEEVWQDILEDAFSARKRAESQAKAEQLLEQDQQHRKALGGSGASGSPGKHGFSIVVPKAAAWAALAACLLLVGWGVVELTNNKPEPTPKVAETPGATPFQTPDASPVIQPKYLATVEASRRAAWSNLHNQPDNAGAMRPGRYVLERGAASVVMSRGASLLLEAPIAFDLLDDNRVQLDSGRLVARVPGRAAGFTVEANELRIIDIGTEFGVEVSPSGEVFASTFEGMIVMREASKDSGGVMLGSGQSVVVQHKQSLESVTKLDALPAERSFARSLDEAGAPATGYRKAVLADKPLIFWRCEEFGEGFVTNEVSTEALRAKVRGPMKLGTGLFGGAGLLNGDASVQSGLVSDGAVLPEGAAGSYTVEAWIKPDRIHRGTIAALYVDDAALQHPLAVNIDMQPIVTEDRELVADKVAFRYSLVTPSDESVQRIAVIDEQVAYHPNQWMHVVAVHEPGVIRLYLNSQMIGEAESDKAAISNEPNPLYLSVGNTGIGIQLNQSNFRTFSGLIDEVAFYNHLLSEEQITNHYKLGASQQE